MVTTQSVMESFFNFTSTSQSSFVSWTVLNSLANRLCCTDAFWSAIEVDQFVRRLMFFCGPSDLPEAHRRMKLEADNIINNKSLKIVCLFLFPKLKARMAEVKAEVSTPEVFTVKMTNMASYPQPSQRSEFTLPTTGTVKFVFYIFEFGSPTNQGLVR